MNHIITSRFNRWIDILVLVLGIGAAVYLVLCFWGVTYDDVFLAFRYAQNLEAGHGFVFNPGENFLGTPAPLFVLALAGIHQLLPWITLPQVGSLLSGLGLACAGGVAYLIGRRWNQRLVGLVAGILIITSPYTVMTLGGETPLFLAMTLGAFYFYSTEKPLLAAMLLGFAMVNRSEAVIPIGLLLTVDWIDHKRVPYKMVLVLATILVPWFLFAFFQFGSPVSSSFTAKIAQVSAGLPRYPYGFLSWSKNLMRGSNYLFLSLIGIAGLGLLALPFAAKPWKLIIAWTALQTLAYAALPIPFYHWYAAQVGVAIGVLGGLGTVYLWGIIRRPSQYAQALPIQSFRAKIASLRDSKMVLSTGSVMMMLTLLGVALFSQARFTRNYQIGMPLSPANRIYTKAGRWLAANTALNASVAYLEIGQIAFYSGRYTIDTLGLVTPGVSPQVAQSNWTWAYAHYQPDYIIYNPVFAHWLDRLYAEDWFVEGYEQVATITVNGYPAELTIFHKKPGVKFPEAVNIDINHDQTNETVGAIFSGYEVEQTFTSHFDRLTAVEVKLATYNRENKGIMDLTLSDASGQQVAGWQLPAREIQDNHWRRFYFTPINESYGQTFTLRIRFDGSDETNAITAWVDSQKPERFQGLLTYHGAVKDGQLGLRTYYRP